MTDTHGRNLRMAARIASAPVRYPFTFVVAGDSGAWPDPTADAILSQLLRQTARLDPPPAFFANLGDFAGPGTADRHEHYLRLVDDLPVPDVCVIGNHDLDDRGGAETWARIHGPRNFRFAYGSTCFVALDAAPGDVGEIDIDARSGVTGPDDEALAFLATSWRPPPSRTASCSCTPRRASATGTRRIRSGASTCASGSSSSSCGVTTSGSCAARTRSSSTTTSTTARTS